MSDEFESLEPNEKAAVEAALNRCRILARQIESELHKKKPEHFFDKVSLADVCVSLERALDVLGQKSRQSVENTPAPAVKGLHGTVPLVIMKASFVSPRFRGLVRTFWQRKRQTQDR